MTTQTNTPSSLLRILRNFMPPRTLEAHEAQSVAERQALKLLALLDQHQPAVNVSAIADLPRIEVRVEPNLPFSGFSQWNRGRWLIGINRDDAPVRRRFTLAHELKHVLDHPFVSHAYLDRQGRPSEKRAEAMCDYFAACLLMPRPWVKQAWVNGIQDQRMLAQLFGVSEAAMALRLRQLGLSEPRVGRWPALDSQENSAAIGRYFRRTHILAPPVGARVGGPLLVGSPA
jgi:Zn-dependent peptidase ImmA (M78 family)